MLANIFFVSADPITPSLRQQISRQVRFIDGTLDKSVMNELKDSADVIISRAYTAEYLRKNLDIPVVDLEISSFDILRSIFRHRNQIIQHNEKEIGLGVYYRSNYDISTIEQITGLKIHVFTYNRLSQIRRYVATANEQGIKTFFGGLITEKHAQSYGMTAYTIRPNQETIFQAISKAIDIRKALQHDQEINEQLEAIINLISEGIIAVGSSNEILFINPKAQNLLNITSNVTGKDANGILPKKLLSKIRSPVPVDSNLINLNQDTFVINSTPILIGTKQIGGLATINVVSSVQVLEHKIRSELYSKGLVAKYSFSDIVGKNDQLVQAIDSARRYAQSDATVLISGESGTGKELFAQSIHQASNRCHGPFVAVNCAALPEQLLESELFGYEEGAFTGARKGGKIGLFEMAHKGTIFLDEISDTSLHIQSSLLRVIQNKQVMRVGGLQLIPVDVRIIAAVNKDIHNLIKSGTFRQDLFYRLNILRLSIPSLRERISDIPYLVQSFLNQMSGQYKKEVMPLSDRVILALQSYEWPGNIRELENYVERYFVLYEPSYNPKMAEDLALSILDNETPQSFNSQQPSITIPISGLDEMERFIISTLDHMSKDKNELAKRLGISRSTLWRKLRNHP